MTRLTTEAAVYHGVRVTLVPFETIKRMSYARNTLRNGVPLSRTFCCDTDFKLEFIGCLKTFRRGHCIYSKNIPIISLSLSSPFSSIHRYKPVHRVSWKSFWAFRTNYYVIVFDIRLFIRIFIGRAFFQTKFPNFLLQNTARIGITDGIRDLFSSHGYRVETTGNRLAAIWSVKISIMLHIRGIPIIRISRRRVLSRASICSVRSRCVAMKRRMLTRIGALAVRQCYATAAFIPANWFVQRILSPYPASFILRRFHLYSRFVRKPPFLSSPLEFSEIGRNPFPPRNKIN